MLIPIIFMLLFFCTNNAKRAQAKALNPITWTLLTILSFSVGIFLACFVLGMIIMAKNPALLTLAQANDRVRMNEFMVANFSQNEFLYSSLIMAGAFGGYLLIRYLIDKKKSIPIS
ncbi:MAG: hypothetical protein V4561_01145 [Bacteroidota bacterium]